MSTTHDLVAVIKAELKVAGITYAELARRLGMAESTIKRSFARGDMPLSRIDAVLKVLRLDFADLARRVADAQPLARELSAEQEAAVVADQKLMLVAICCLSHWSFDQITASYAIDTAECIACLTRLDRLGLIELRPGNRYRVKLAKGFRWRPHGPVMRYFRDRVAPDYFDDGFDGVGETLMLVHGQISPDQSAALVERLQRVGQDFAQQHLIDQKLPPGRAQPFTLVVGMRSWLFAAFRDLQR